MRPGQATHAVDVSTKLAPFAAFDAASEIEVLDLPRSDRVTSLKSIHFSPHFAQRSELLERHSVAIAMIVECITGFASESNAIVLRIALFWRLG